jgi:nucleotide-binding universal stress UspA family protein
MKTILAAVDFSDSTLAVMTEAIALARAMNAKLLALHVVQPPIMTGDEFGTQMSAEYAANASESAAKRLAILQKQLQVAEGATVETTHVLGSPGERILEVARTSGADYLVLGSHGRGAFYDLVVGSTTGHVLRSASCPVVIVPRVKTKKSRR